LIGNAIKHSPQGGDIDVRLALNGREAVVSVADRGFGIPKEKQGRIFQRFYRAHTNTPFDYGGLGLGLFLSWEIVRRHGGRMWFQSEEHKGSTFSFGLPLAADPLAT
jgi:signal transduction histidine kinase